MKLIVNTAALTPPLTGIGHYTANLLSCLLEDGCIEDVRGLSGSATHWLDRPAIERLLAGQSAQEPEVVAEVPPAPPSLALRIRHALWRRFVAVAKHVPGARRARTLLFRATASKTAQNWDDYLYWEPNYIALPLNNRSVVTVYDLSHMAHPEFHPAERVEAMNQALPDSIRNARRIITISEYTRQEIMREFEVPEAQIDIVPPAVSDEFRQPAVATQVAAVREKHNLPEHYLLSVGTLEPRKNVVGLLRCYLQLPQALRQRYPLVLVGVKGWLTGELEQKLAPLVASGEVRQLGYVDQADLPVLYQQASALAYISFFEGYGMPVAEAMAAGTAVLTSDRTSMPEVAQGAALLTDPGNDEQIVEQLHRLLSDDELRRQLAAEGQRIAADYCWQRSAQLLKEALARV
ncbi:MAG: glycosyltransferase family 4 protein [Marinobacterium sp.]|nr:glycosyltransferase family 4 protein [Marinobacterium sp.]